MNLCAAAIYLLWYTSFSWQTKPCFSIASSRQSLHPLFCSIFFSQLFLALPSVVCCLFLSHIHDLSWTPGAGTVLWWLPMERHLSCHGYETHLGICKSWSPFWGWSLKAWAGGCFWFITQQPSIAFYNAHRSCYPQFLINFTDVQHPQHQAGLVLNHALMYQDPLIFLIYALNATLTRNLTGLWFTIKINTRAFIRIHHWSHSLHRASFSVILYKYWKYLSKYLVQVLYYVASKNPL